MLSHERTRRISNRLIALDSGVGYKEEQAEATLKFDFADLAAHDPAFHTPSLVEEKDDTHTPIRDKRDRKTNEDQILGIGKSGSLILRGTDKKSKK